MPVKLVVSAVVGIVLGCLAGLLAGCYHVPSRQLVGAAPPSPAQVATCQRELDVRNWSNVLAGGFGGTGAFTGAAAADIQGNRPMQIGVEVGAITLAAAGVAMVVTGAITSNNYGANRCDAVLAAP